MTTKLCRKCQIEKPIRNFWRKKFAQDGRNEICAECMKEYQRHRYAEAMKKEQELRDVDPNRWKALLQNRLYLEARRRSSRLGVEFTIRPEEIPVGDACPILLVPLFKSANTISRNTPSLDRVDSSLGYIPGNVRVISWVANNVKSNLTVDEVTRLLAYMKGEI